MSRLRTHIDLLLPQIKGVPIVALSARTGDGVDRLMAAVLESHAVWNRRVPTAALNRFLAQAVEARGLINLVLPVQKPAKQRLTKGGSGSRLLEAEDPMPEIKNRRAVENEIAV